MISSQITFDVIRKYPGCDIEELCKETGLSEELIEDHVLGLKISNKITSVGRKLYSLSDFPNIAPDTTLVYKVIKEYPSVGCSYQTLQERTGFAREVIMEEIKFLRSRGRIRNEDRRYFPEPLPDDVNVKDPLFSNVDFLTRDELLALVKLFIQQTKWAQNSLDSAEQLIRNRRNIHLAKRHDATAEETFTNAGGQFAGIKADGTFNLGF